MHLSKKKSRMMTHKAKKLVDFLNFKYHEHCYGLTDIVNTEEAYLGFCKRVRVALKITNSLPTDGPG